ncbi:YggS family pyridoxal phosphate-dependent enzyme [Rufibacter latericius]|uniref:Pyridoxal phosphate homeostasis protein n=1 Tax=Rufibacter latericius TaxID=2487040 RepID=A0A3M9MHG1_9BACT|nr:YggS family pyridoxal phosphate-dependent enzyme [Rufibacter latericius]RNI24999.1 YggS family pyridoxal phosphate-dependent enzyme [Rufibacter latericius]
MTIQENIRDFQSRLAGTNCRLIAVSKTHPVELIQEAYDGGQRAFGENKAQEMKDKQPQLPADVEWHMIGHLQTNKVKYIAPFVHLIQSVDSLRLLQEIDKQGQKHSRVIDCLLQFYIAEEETKFGLDLEEARQILRSDEFSQLGNVRICGVMGVATNTNDSAHLQREFARLRGYFEALREEFFPGVAHFKEISMGMSSDYQLAISEGSTIIRVGSAIFGNRDYSITT